MEILFYLDIKDWIILLLPIIWTIIWTIILYELKPSIKITSICSGKASIYYKEKDIKSEEYYVKVCIENLGSFNAVNINMEICIVCGDYTYHLDIDKDAFLILPPKKNGDNSSKHIRCFKSFDLSESARKYVGNIRLQDFITQKECAKIRVRVHATHEYSGFGRAFEEELNLSKIQKCKETECY